MGPYLAQHHYLGFHRPVGESIKYLVRDRYGRDLACALFGLAAWKLAPRDAFIGWSDRQRHRNLILLTNNTRFLVLPWVVVPHLASHILGLVLRRLRADWRSKYGHPVHLVETFVDRARFRGTCYRATNWQCVGQTQGRSRQDPYTTLWIPFKEHLPQGILSGGVQEKIYASLVELQADLDAWLASYNHERPDQGHWCYGKTPMQTFVDSVPLAKEKMLAV